MAILQKNQTVFFASKIGTVHKLTFLYYSNSFSHAWLKDTQGKSQIYNLRNVSDDECFAHDLAFWRKRQTEISPLKIRQAVSNHFQTIF